MITSLSPGRGSGVARVPCAQEAKHFLRPYQQKLPIFKKKICAKARRKQ